MDKKNIFFIQPVFYRPELPNFKDRFELLSDRCCGHVVSECGKERTGLKFGEFEYHGLTSKKGLYKHLYYASRTVLLGLKANSAKKIDFIHSYDPLTYGIAAAVIKLLTGAKMIVEVNGNLLEDGFLERKGFPHAVKRFIFKILVRISLGMSDKVKFLNREQARGWKTCFDNQCMSIFHDYVPTHVFNPAKSSDKRYILFMGHPFHRKGVDVLIKAFLKIKDKHPDVTLKIVGHCPEAKERKFYESLAGGCSQIEIERPVLYDEAIQLLQDCTFFVLPSRSEAMGRVLIEAMACGKPVIGSRVGGIPDIIEDGGNGFLFEPCNAEDLAFRMECLLSNPAISERMRKRSLEIVEKRFSSKRYAEKFLEL